ncbi:MAG: 30S ribosomal protein S21 [Candidimonas sp.]
MDVKNNNIDGALKALKKRLMNDGFYKDIKRIESYEKPSEKRRREKAEARRRHLKKMSQQSDRI